MRLRSPGRRSSCALLKSIEQGLKSVEAMKAGVEQRFQAVSVLSADELLSDLVGGRSNDDSFRGSPLHAG